MIATLVGFAISWYFGFTPVFVAGAALSFLFPRLFRALFWLFTFPAFLTIGASVLTLIAGMYDIAPFDFSTWHTCLYIACIPAFLTTNYILQDFN